MSQWWTYRPSDLLMFSASSWGRLIELHNREHWPLHLAMLALAAVVTWATIRPLPALVRAAALGLAIAWAWVGWAFHWTRHAEINTAAPYLGGAFAVQALLLVWISLAGPAPKDVRRFPRTGLAIALAAILLWPLSAPLTGRSWLQAEVFGMAAEPTALATLGFLLAVGLRHRGWAMPIPIASLVLGIGTLWLLYSPA